MTRRREPDPHEQAAHHWLARHQHTLTNALDDLIDAEAGLREVLLHSRHDTATDHLDAVLDTEAGLTAILPDTPRTPAPSTHDTPHDHAGPDRLLHALSPGERMTVRSHPDVKAASQALAEMDRSGLDLSPARVLTFVLDLNDILRQDLARARELALALAGTRHRTREIASDRVVARAIASVLDRARDLISGLSGDLERARDFNLDIPDCLPRARALDLDLADARELVDKLDRELGRARALDVTNDIEDKYARELGHAHAHEAARAIEVERARELADELARARDRSLDRSSLLSLLQDPVFDRGRVFATIDHVRTAEIRRAMGLALRREVPALSKNSLSALLDDFTTADLRDADLTGIDLSGVHWSEHGTQWPPAIDVEDLKTHSEETSPHNGTWIVRSGTAPIHNHAEL